jgi:hypothetical protein
MAENQKDNQPDKTLAERIEDTIPSVNAAFDKAYNRPRAVIERKLRGTPTEATSKPQSIDVTQEELARLAAAMFDLPPLEELGPDTAPAVPPPQHTNEQDKAS